MNVRRRQLGLRQSWLDWSVAHRSQGAREASRFRLKEEVESALSGATYEAGTIHFTTVEVPE
jgi:hypothetical protein